MWCNPDHIDIALTKYSQTQRPVVMIFQCLVDHCDLHSFPTRRSSDLQSSASRFATPRAADAGRGRRADSLERAAANRPGRSEEHTSELQSPCNFVCRLLLIIYNCSMNVISTHTLDLRGDV